MFKRWYQASLRHQILIWLLVINFFVLALMALATLQVSRSLVEKNIFDQLEREHLIEAELMESSLNRMIEEVKALRTSLFLINVLNSPERAMQILEPFVTVNPLIREDHNDLYLLDASARRVYSISASESWATGSDDLVKNALLQSKTLATILKINNQFVLQIAQPIEGRGVVVLSQPVHQLLSRFFQGRSDIDAWTLEYGSEVILSSRVDASGTEQKIAHELFNQRQQYQVNDLTIKKSSAADPAWKTVKAPMRLVPPLSDLQLKLVLTERTNWTRIVAMQLLWPFMFVLVVVSLIATLIIAFAGRRLATPIEALEAYALSIDSTGHTSPENQAKLSALEGRTDEVGRLSSQFSSMLARLRQSYEGLEGQVARRNAQLESIFALSPDGFIEIDAQGNVGFVNPAFEMLTSLSAIGIVGKPVAVLAEKLYELSSSLTLSQIQVMLEPSEQFQWLELHIPYKRALLVLTKSNQLDGSVVYLHDVTQAADLEEMRSTFMSTAAHELRTPISSILGYAELLMRRLKGGAKPSQEMIEEMVAVIERQSRSMADLVNDLLDLSRLENQMAKGLNFHETPLATYLRPVVAQFQMAGDDRELVTYIDDHLPEVQLNPENFKRLIVNLLSNAFKYSPKGSPVIVKTFTEKIAEQLYVGVSIQDYGDGMSEEDLAHAFERFYRSSKHEKISGTGLGLAIAKEIMQAHSGEIHIESAIGQGTTVTLLFPVHRFWGRNP